MTKLSQAIALATAMTAGLAATATTQAEVEVSASAGLISSASYLFLLCYNPIRLNPYQGSDF